MALTEADREQAREIAASAPPPPPELIERLRAILAGCVPAPVLVPAPELDGFPAPDDGVARLPVLHPHNRKAAS